MSHSRRSIVALISLVATASGISAWLRRRRRRRDPRVFILEYHDVSDNAVETEGVISAERFERHLRYLRQHYRFESLSGAAAQLSERCALTEDLLVVTFDDGYAGNGEAAAPVLEKKGVPAVIFLATGFLDGSELWFDLARRVLAAARRAGPSLSAEAAGSLRGIFGRWPPAGGIEASLERLKRLEPEARSRCLREMRRLPLELSPAAVPLRWEQVRRLHRAASIEFGCHTVSHPILPSLPRALQEKEILDSRNRIAEETGVAPRTFAYPNGDFNDETLAILRANDFTAACSTIKGSNRPGCDRLKLRRIGVGADPCFVLAARLAGLFDEEVRRRLAR